MKKIVLIALTLLFFIPFTVSADEVKRHEVSGQAFHYRQVKAFGTDNYILISYDDPKANNYIEYLEEAVNIFTALHNLTDNFRPAFNEYRNNVYYINNHPNEWIEIDKRLYDIIDYALNLKEFTDGYFDISIGYIIDGWKDIIEGKVPSAQISNQIALIEQMPVVENGIVLDIDGSIYKIKISDGVKIDLGALAKGYAVEEVDKYFKANGLKHYFIQGSASSLKYGTFSDQRNKYKIDISNPYYIPDDELQDWIDEMNGVYNPNKVYGTVSISNNSLSTSGDTNQNIKYEGQVLHHIISPKTKWPENHYRVLTIAHPDAAFSDALTTAMFSMDQTQLNAFVNKLNSSENTSLFGYITFGFDGTVNEQLSNLDFIYNGSTNNGDEIINKTFKDWILISSAIVVLGIGFYMIVESKNKKEVKE